MGKKYGVILLLIFSYCYQWQRIKHFFCSIKTFIDFYFLLTLQELKSLKELNNNLYNNYFLLVSNGCRSFYFLIKMLKDLDLSARGRGKGKSGNLKEESEDNLYYNLFIVTKEV